MATAVLLIGIAGWFWRPLLWAYAVLAPVIIIGLWDLYFTSNTILNISAMSFGSLSSVAVRALNHGADICNSARGMMFALGCIQALKCDTDECPTGITTHNPSLTRGLVVSAKARRVANFQQETVKAALELLDSMGLERFGDLQRHQIQKRINGKSVESFEDIFPTVEAGAYLNQSQ